MRISSRKKLRRDALRLLVGMAVLVIAAVACRQNQPGEDPKMPPNSPLPDIERPQDEPSQPSLPSPLSKDGGG